jgi:hypothetical protein
VGCRESALASFHSQEALYRQHPHR